jgi:hypothetical protein
LIKTRRTIGGESSTYKGTAEKNIYICAGFCLENLKERDHFEDLVLEGTLILKLILKKQKAGRGVGLLGAGHCHIEGPCEHFN